MFSFARKDLELSAPPDSLTPPAAVHCVTAAREDDGSSVLRGDCAFIVSVWMLEHDRRGFRTELHSEGSLSGEADGRAVQSGMCF